MAKQSGSSGSTLGAHYSRVVRALLGLPGVSSGSGRRGFGSDALQVDGRIFAMARRGGLVLKLPAERVEELIATGAGAAFDAGKGRPMKEWVVVGEQASRRWVPLAKEALAHVARRS